MSETQNNQSVKPPERVAFTEALSSALSVSKPELKRRVDRMKSEKVSRYKRYKYVPAKPRAY